MSGRTSEAEAPPLAILGAALIIPAIILRAWVLTVLWGWYVVPAFGAEPLRIVHAFGLALLLSYATHRRLPKGQEDHGLISSLIYGASLALVSLAIGWAGTWFA